MNKLKLISLASSVCTWALLVSAVAPNRATEGANLNRRLQLPDFEIDPASMEVEATTEPSGPAPVAALSAYEVYTFSEPVSSETRSIILNYEYSGARDNVEFGVMILDSECALEIVGGPISSAAEPEVDINGIAVSLLVDVDGAQIFEDSSLWFRAVGDHTSAQIKFCVRLQIMLDAVVVDEADVVATIDVDTSAGDFSTAANEIDIEPVAVQSTATSLTLDFQTIVFACNSNAEAVTELLPLNPGHPVRFCVTLANAESMAYVSSVETIE